ncbi:antibiotic biosynthesis monooxygenase [Cognatiyoonia sp. IB215182]|uniref:antibiotic biosynthesis monooxygenase family protein n=1 Tax=Cognatiyoonia sp. IB215182 TaxID=3097353 RepID=UPI002A166C99|nr:antibiotic biosynthesis monooxygenase [Cognatiyoonia sp. IB215182]MDX8354764.1 antibiotic biosynthesis monooxygenase [Cognatiyoonia sp. IB215182]
MFIAMNRFTVAKENEEAFEALWLGRDSFLKTMDGFVEFQMLKGPEAEDGTRLYASHTVWSSEETFRAWTRSDAFRAAHKDAGTTAKLHQGSPQFEGFNVIQTIA